MHQMDLQCGRGVSRMAKGERFWVMLDIANPARWPAVRHQALEEELQRSPATEPMPDYIRKAFADE